MCNAGITVKITSTATTIPIMTGALFLLNLKDLLLLSLENAYQTNAKSRTIIIEELNIMALSPFFEKNSMIYLR